MLEEAKQVCPTTAQRQVRGGALLVDVREAAELAHIAFSVPGIVNIPLMALEQRWAELPKRGHAVGAGKMQAVPQ